MSDRAISVALLKDLKNHDVFLLCGLPGSGKSTIAKQLAKTLSAENLSSDKLRRELFQSSRYDEEKLGDAEVRKLSAQVYEKMYKRAIEAAGREHKKVIIDATHLDTEKRRAYLALLLNRLKSERICYLKIDPDTETIRRHMRATNIYEDWERIFAIFQSDWKAGKLSWPTAENERVAVYSLYDTSGLS